MDQEGIMATRGFGVTKRGKKLDPWEVGHAADTLLEAERIKRNPTMMRAARTELTKRKANIEKTMGMKR